MLQEEIRSYLRDQGADAVGFGSAERYEKAPVGHRPGDLLPGGKSVISLAVSIFDGVFSSPNPRLATHAWSLVNSEIHRLCFQAAKKLESRGFRAAPVSSFLPIDILGKNGMMGDISHKHAAELAGIGRIGFSHLLITPQFGPRVRLASIVTDLPAQADPLLTEDFCEGCAGRPCVKACPAGAIGEDGQLAKIKCLDAYQAFGGRSLIRFLKELVEAEGREKRLEMLKYPKMLELLEIHQFVRVGGVTCLECMRACPVGKGPPKGKA